MAIKEAIKSSVDVIINLSDISVTQILGITAMILGLSTLAFVSGESKGQERDYKATIINGILFSLILICSAVFLIGLYLLVH